MDGMPRHNRRADDPVDPADRPRMVIGERIEAWRGEDYVVRSLTGARAARPYRCPGCDQVVAGGVPHVVVWPVEDADADDRRHWHSPCWGARDRREPTVQRGRGSPRY